MRIARVATKLTIAISLAGLLLHLYAVAFKTEGAMSFGSVAFLGLLLLWSLLPYGLWAAVATTYRQPEPAVGACIATFAADIFVYYSVFIAPQASTAAVAFIFAPIWNLVLFGPAGAVVSWPVLSFLRKASAA